MEESWEVLSVPAEIQHSTVGKKMEQADGETSETSQDKTQKTKVS